ncbi:hypothetical protein D3C80_1810680 [compost metagenome]
MQPLALTDVTGERQVVVLTVKLKMRNADLDRKNDAGLGPVAALDDFGRTL